MVASWIVEHALRVPSYQYFCQVWREQCSHIKLKKAMRFTKCDVCTLANEALDVERKKGSVGWLTPAMESVIQHLLDHYEVCAWCVLVYVCMHRS